MNSRERVMLDLNHVDFRMVQLLAAAAPGLTWQNT